MKRILALLGVLVLTVSSFSVQAFAETDGTQTQTATAPQIDSEAAIVMDATTGAILYQKNMTEKLAPADPTQIMTVLLGLESGKSNDKVTVTEELLKTVDKNGSHISLSEGEQVRMTDLYYAIMLSSAADAARVVATHVSGSVDRFLEAMTARMRAMGAMNTSFTSVDGEPEENNYSTAEDLAILTKEALKNATFREIFGKTTYTMDATNKNSSERSFTTVCMLMKNSEMDVKYEATVGGKSGWNKDAKYTLVSAAEKDGKTLICVILGSDSSKQRYEETIALYDYSFAAYRNVSVPTSLLPEREIPVMKNGTIVRKILVSIPEGTLLTTNANFQEGTMTVSSLPDHVTEGDTNLRLTVSAKDANGNTIVLGTVILDIETKDMDLGEEPGGEKQVPKSFGAKVWNVIKGILLTILIIIGVVVLLVGILILLSYLERRKRKARRKKLREERQRAELEEAQEPVYTGRRHRKTDEE